MRRGVTLSGQEDQIMQEHIIHNHMKLDSSAMEVIMTAIMEDSSLLGILKFDRSRGPCALSCKAGFEGTCIAVKLSGIHWWYKTASHAAELTAGFYNPCIRDGYAPIAQMRKKHNATLNFTCVELRTLDHHEDFPEALADHEGLVCQVLNAAWDVKIQVASENALPCYDRDGYNKILENAKPLNNPDRRHLSAFSYLRRASFDGETISWNLSAL